MASISMATTMSLTPSTTIQNRIPQSKTTFFNPLNLKPSKMVSSSKSRVRVEVSGSLREKLVTGLSAGALTASMVIPDVAEAAEGSGVSPSLKNFLLSITAGGIVLVAIIGAVIGVSNFDPVKRG